MKAKALLFAVLSAGLCLCSGALAADAAPAPPSSPPDAKGALPRALNYLVKTSNEWMEDHNCATCHHVTMTIWSLREAKAAGTVFDSGTLEKTVQWAISPKVSGTTFPENRKDDRARFSLPAGYLALALSGTEGVPAEWWKKLREDVLTWQKPDGSWELQKDGRPPILSPVAENFTLVAANALAAEFLRQPDAGVTAALEKTLTWLASHPAGEETQDHAMRVLLYARLNKAPEEVKKEMAWLRAKQKEDGGWSQAPSTAAAADAHATGQAVLAMSVAGVASEDAAMQKARGFLTKTQAADGSWPMGSRPNGPGKGPAGNLEPITTAGTAWAAIALARTEGKK